MIHVRIDNHQSTGLDIYVNISPPKPSVDEHIYDRLFDTNNYPTRQSKIVSTRTNYLHSSSKKNYTLQQILDNVETIQQQYEQVLDNRKTSSSSSSCFFTFKHITKILKNLRTIKQAKSNDQSIDKTSSSSSLINSPFTFGGETLQWIALPQEDEENHIYENTFLD